MKVGDNVVCIKECRMEKNPADKRTTIGKTYTIKNDYDYGWYIIDDIGHEHYFTDVFNKYFRSARKEKLLKINIISEKL